MLSVIFFQGKSQSFEGSQISETGYVGLRVGAQCPGRKVLYVYFKIQDKDAAAIQNNIISSAGTITTIRVDG
jgi:hypothetical protein